MTYQSPRGFVKEITCPSAICSHKTKGHRTARGTIVCHWCGKVLEDKDRGIDLFPELERAKKYNSL